MRDDAASQTGTWILCPRCARRNAEFNPRCLSCGQTLLQQCSGPVEPGLTVTPVPASRTRAADALLLGQSLAQYRLVELLGRGGMGVVYQAEHQFSSSSLSREALDVEGGAAGTLAYMAPEQIRGEALDARADLYALGCLLFELLTGQPPFVGGTAQELIEGHLRRSPRAPSELSPQVPAALDELVLKLLSKSPRQRPGHADVVAAALAALGADAETAEADPKNAAYLYRPGFAGREPTLQTLRERLSELQTGAGGLLFIGGESGIGKTRLLLELAREAGRMGVRVLAGECLDAGSGPLEALRKPLQAVADRCRAGGKEETERLLGRRAKVLGLYEPVLRELPGVAAYPEPAELPAAAARLRLFTDLSETFAALASQPAGADPSGLRPAGSASRSAPTLLILDDLQWADELTLGFLEFLLGAERSSQSRWLLVGAHRSEETASAGGASLRALLQAPGVEHLILERFGETAVGSMVGDMLALQPTPEHLVRFLTLQSEGNPFFVAEYLRTAVAEGILWRDAQGRWQVAEPSTEEATEAVYAGLPLPRSLRELVRRRLEGLAPLAATAVEAAAVVGREVDSTLLQAIAGLAEEPLQEALDELLRRQILELTRQGRPRFVHDKLRELTYAELPAGRRAMLHRAAAEAIEAAIGEPAADPALLGHHWERAGEPERARDRYLEAARKEAARYAHDLAVSLYRAGLALFPAPTSASIAARNELSEQVLFPLGRTAEALEQARMAVEEARLIGDPDSRVTSLNTLGYIHWKLGAVEEFRQCFEEALQVARAAGDRSLEAQALGSLSNFYSHTGTSTRQSGFCSKC